MLISEEERKIHRNSGVSNVYTFYHADFEGVVFFVTRRYVHLTNEGREEEFFVSDEDKDDEVLPFSELTLLV